MHDKSHVCLVCGKPFDTGAILLDKRLRARMERHATTGWGLCPEHQKLADDGFVALVECDLQRSGSQAGWPHEARTGIRDGPVGPSAAHGIHAGVQRANCGRAGLRVR